MREDGSVAGEGRVVGVPKFHSWGKCTMTLTNINSDWMSNVSSGLRINYAGPLGCILGYILLLSLSYSWTDTCTCCALTKNVRKSKFVW